MARQKPPTEHSPQSPGKAECRDVDGYYDYTFGEGVKQTPSMSSRATKAKTGPTMSKVPVHFDDVDE